MASGRNSSSLPQDPARRGFLSRFLPRKLRRVASDEGGVTAIEFSMIALPFFMLLLGLIEFGLAFFVNRILDYAALETTRQIRTGQAMKSGVSKAAFKTELCGRMTRVLCNESRLTVDIQTFSDFQSLSDIDSLVDDDGELEEDPAFSIGGASDIVIARVVYEWPMFTSLMNTDSGDTSDMSRRLYTTVVFRNEPFPW
ncbi:TadE/TadG family type IV pilus assembly protein [Roseibium limicola]|uniref:Pilus assembly protein n=1 Tax=Roseibium limicola TaxID=2816037 RepID=A0A939EMY2_9HYPH|nr:TadE/TadG family type IV pilus assembly protein [Roseibium limicola]MBO0345685.1 pilus assembly protein [Roseibium limicola]